MPPVEFCTLTSDLRRVPDVLPHDDRRGLAAYVQSGDLDHARRVAARMRAGNPHINYPA